MSEVIAYITHAPFFWQTMGSIVACAMFIGATLYNGDLSALRKALLTMGAYAALVTLVDSTRIIHVYNTQGIQNYAQAFAGIATLVFVSFFYLLGLFIGVFVVHRVKYDTIK
jgi:hypothetical protein